MKTYKVKCYYCGKEQLYQPRKKWIGGLRKKCTNCEKQFIVTKGKIKEVFWNGNQFK